MTLTKVALSLGSNIGDKAGYIAAAVKALSETTGIHVKTLSSLYQTAPWGDTDQDWFLNACVTIETNLSPDDLLIALKAIETNLGRIATRRWGPRAIDIDILVYGSLEMEADHLTIPHANLVNRVFVLVPLIEIWPDLTVFGETPEAHLSKLPREPGDIFLYHRDQT